MQRQGRPDRHRSRRRRLRKCREIGAPEYLGTKRGRNVCTFANRPATRQGLIMPWRSSPMLMSGLRRLLWGTLSALCACCAFQSPGFAQTDLASRMKDPGQWPMAARDYANTRYSALDQINASNASRLQLAWTFS